MRDGRYTIYADSPDRRGDAGAESTQEMRGAKRLCSRCTISRPTAARHLLSADIDAIRRRLLLAAHITASRRAIYLNSRAEKE